MLRPASYRARPVELVVQLTERLEDVAQQFLVCLDPFQFHAISFLAGRSEEVAKNAKTRRRQGIVGG